jgi:hypothetical protein
VLVGATGHDDGGKHGGRAYALAGNDLFLNGTPRRLAPGDVYVRTLREGTPTNPNIIALVEVNDIPIFLVPDGLGHFDSQGSREIDIVIPPGLSGIRLAFQAFALNQQGYVIASAREHAVFE